MDTEKPPMPSISMEDNFFIPNLCAPNALLVLAISAPTIAAILILANGDVLTESWDEWILVSALVAAIVFVSAASLCVFRRWLSKLSFKWGAILSYLIVIAVTAIICGIVQHGLVIIKYQWGNSPETIAHFVTRCILISMILTLILMYVFHVEHQWKQEIELSSQARVEALQAKIRPHFLFNSMNIIASLIETQPKLAEQAVEDLSEIFRATLKDKGAMVPLSEEWILCRNYLRIEGLRLGERLIVDADLSLVPQDAAIPMLTLQPLVENAVYHGIQPLEKGGVIKVQGTMEDNIIHIHISNPVPPSSQEPPPKGNKIALANIRHRLNLLFGSHAKLRVKASPEDYEVIISFPYLKSGM